jgi:hypothetical protein
MSFITNVCELNFVSILFGSSFETVLLYAGVIALDYRVAVLAEGGAWLEHFMSCDWILVLQARGKHYK